MSLLPVNHILVCVLQEILRRSELLRLELALLTLPNRLDHDLLIMVALNRRLPSRLRRNIRLLVDLYEIGHGAVQLRLLMKQLLTLCVHGGLVVE